MIDDALAGLTFLSTRLAALRRRASMFREQLALTMAAAIAQRFIADHGRTVRQRAQHSWDGWDDEDLEDEMRGMSWPNVIRSNAPVGWMPFRNGEPQGQPPVVKPGLPLVPSDPHAFLREHVLPARFMHLAEQWKEECGADTSLPMRGEEIAWDFANSMMGREFLLARYIVLRTLGLEDSTLADALTKQILNEWHALEPEAGLTDAERELLHPERSKEPSA
jgi:hypothetical protein